MSEHNNHVTQAELLFRTKFRDQWATLLSSEMGRTLISALYSRKPPAIPGSQPHQDSHRLGQVMNFDIMMEFLAVTLTTPFTNITEIPQDYPDDDEQPQKPKKES